MIKLGRVSRQTQGPLLVGFVEDPACKVPGAYYPCPFCEAAKAVDPFVR